MYDIKAKGLFFKEISKKFMTSLLKNWVVLIKKYEKNEVKWKAFNQCKHFGEGSYIFISASEIGHLTLCYSCMTWLNWSLKLHTRLWTSSYLNYTHNTSLMFDECLFHLCDCTCSNVFYVCSIAWWSNPKIFWSVSCVSGSDFCHFGPLSFSQNVKFLVL